MLKNPSPETLRTALIHLEREEREELFWLQHGLESREKLQKVSAAVRELRALLAEVLLAGCKCTAGNYDDACPAHGSGVVIVSHPHGAERDWR